jgi:hypothetical protein
VQNPAPKSTATWALVRDAVRGMPRGELQVKGLPNPVATHEVAEPAPV